MHDAVKVCGEHPSVVEPDRARHLDAISKRRFLTWLGPLEDDPLRQGRGFPYHPLDVAVADSDPWAERARTPASSIPPGVTRSHKLPSTRGTGFGMNTIDYVYRFDPKNPSTKPPPPDADSARRNLEDGNRMFSRWMEN